MKGSITPELLALMACPDCRSDLLCVEGRLECSHCRRDFEIRSGIPVLYPDGMDLSRLREEEGLAGIKRQGRLDPKQEFMVSQWRSSKQEFWEMVKENVSPPPKTLINIGSGRDSNFRQFQDAGYVFVNFDIVYDMLCTLKKTCDATACVAGDIGDPPFKRNSFDYVISIDVVHHKADDIRSVLQSFKDLLKPGGTLFLEDLNAWAIFQMAKSILLPRPLFRFLRSTYRRLRHPAYSGSEHEFPTSVWHVKRTLCELGFRRIRIHANTAYPCTSEFAYRFYSLFKNVEWVRKYHNFHYMLSADRGE